jgi:hypothetical protein
MCRQGIQNQAKHQTITRDSHEHYQVTSMHSSSPSSNFTRKVSWVDLLADKTSTTLPTKMASCDFLPSKSTYSLLHPQGARQVNEQILPHRATILMHDMALNMIADGLTLT